MTATTGRSALIIGASRGLGCALAAEYLAGAGRWRPRCWVRPGPAWTTWPSPRTDAWSSRLGGPAVPLTIGQSIPGVADTIEAQAGKGGLQYLDYRGRTVRW